MPEMAELMIQQLSAKLRSIHLKHLLCCTLNSIPLENWRKPPGRPRTTRGWRLSSSTWNPITFAWMKQSVWLRIIHSGDWCLGLVLCTPSSACQQWWRMNKMSHNWVSMPHRSIKAATQPWCLLHVTVCTGSTTRWWWLLLNLSKNHLS